MILEVDDQGRIERRLIGGCRLNTSGYESIWFDKAVWDVTLIADDMYTKTYRLTRKAS